jgi:hypothetical protein
MHVANGHRALRLAPLPAGARWAFAGLGDRDGSLLDLNGATVEWGLMGRAHTIAIAPADVIVEHLDRGRCVIRIPRAKTATLDPGDYTDAVRVTTQTGGRHCGAGSFGSAIHRSRLERKRARWR